MTEPDVIREAGWVLGREASYMSNGCLELHDKIMQHDI
jgi:hypothetical protein